MPRTHTLTVNRRVPYSADLIFQVIANVEEYSQFIPYCQGSRVLKRSKVEENGESVVAELKIGFGLLNYTYVSKLKIDNLARTIKIESHDYPLNELHGDWIVDPVTDHQCCVTFDLKFEFRNHILDITTKGPFTRVYSGIVDAFVDRAKKLSKSA
jgi:coenzyme Q-binding protein COQ10